MTEKNPRTDKGESPKDSFADEATFELDHGEGQAETSEDFLALLAEANEDARKSGNWSRVAQLTTLARATESRAASDAIIKQRQEYAELVDRYQKVVDDANLMKLAIRRHKREKITIAIVIAVLSLLMMTGCQAGTTSTDSISGLSWQLTTLLVFFGLPLYLTVMAFLVLSRSDKTMARWLRHRHPSVYDEFWADRMHRPDSKKRHR